MAERTFPISEFQDKITYLPEQFDLKPEAITITKDGKPIMTILPYDVYQSLLEKLESLQETLEIMQDEELMASLREGIEAMERGETVAWEDVQRKLGFE